MFNYGKAVGYIMTWGLAIAIYILRSNQGIKCFISAMKKDNINFKTYKRCSRHHDTYTYSQLKHLIQYHMKMSRLFQP